MSFDAVPFGPFLLLNRVAVGGTGEVFLARPPARSGLPEQVALKRLHPQLARDPVALRALIKEAQVAVQLSHRNLATVYEVGEVDGRVYLALEYVDGLRLTDLIAFERARGAVVPWPLVTTIGVALSEALAYVHRAKSLSGETLDLVHRDVNPSNVMVSLEGEVKLIDFGVARASGTHDRSQTEGLTGTVRYAPPETFLGQAVSGAADVYGVGATLFECLVGEPPFHGGLAQVIHHVLHAAPPDLMERRTDLPKTLVEAVRAAMAKRAEDRPTALGLGQQLAAALGEAPTEPRALATWVSAVCAFSPAHPPPAPEETVSIVSPSSRRLSQNIDALPELKPGDTVARYTVVDRLAQGGMAEVWLARSEGPGGFAKTLALKTIRDPLAHDAEFQARFLDEARLAALINHPNVVQIFDVGIDAGRAFLAMEYLEGQNLGSVRRALTEAKQLLPPRLAARLIAECCAGLDFAHRLHDPTGRPLKVVHRDLSSNNIFVTYAGQVKVVDFGLATAADSGRFTQAGLLQGTFSYLAPEQIRAETVTHQADLWALGVNLYALLTGRLPFSGPSPAAVLMRITDEAPEPPTRLRSGLPPELERITLKALSKRPADRYRHAGLLRADLEAYLRDEGPASGYDIARALEPLFPTSARQAVANQAWPGTQTALSQPSLYTKRSAAKRRIGWGVAAAALIVGAVAAGGAWRQNQPAADLTSSPPAPSVTAPVPVSVPPTPLGGMNLSCNVPCDLEVDGAQAQRAPLKLSGLSAGFHTIRAVTASGKAERQVRVPVREGQVSSRTVIFENGRLAIRAAPWADVRVDGRAVGQTPFAPLTLLEGRHEVELSNQELHARRRVGAIVRPGRLEELNIKMK